MTPDFQTARRQWLEKQVIYDALSKQVISLLKEGCQTAGIIEWVSGRRKETSSLLKKLMTKGRRYEELTDKAGARVVVRFREQLRPAEAVIENAFRVIRREDKTEKLGHNQVGYQAVHYDVMLVPTTAESGLQDRQCEIQVRTLCQNLWAEMDHPLSYKPAPEVARDVTRQINLLNALLELADRHFSALNAMIRSGANPVLQMLTSLERHNYRFAARPYDPELAQTSIRLFLPLYPLYDEELAKIELAIDEFVEANAEKLSLNYDEYGQIQDPPLFLYQPELYLILHALQTDSFVLEERWCSEYPVEELERVATMWGIPLG